MGPIPYINKECNVFKFLRKKTTSAAVNSFKRRLTTIDQLHRDGRMSQVEYQAEQQKVLTSYQEFAATTPAEYLPEGAKNVSELLGYS
jgi:hypothetical protein